jgi:hypothetical protein
MKQLVLSAIKSLSLIKRRLTIQMTELKWYRIHASRITHYTARVQAVSKDKAKDMKSDNWDDSCKEFDYVRAVEEV